MRLRGNIGLHPTIRHRSEQLPKCPQWHVAVKRNRKGKKKGSVYYTMYAETHFKINRSGKLV